MALAVEAAGSYWLEKYAFESRSDSTFNHMGDEGNAEESESDSESDSEELDDWGEARRKRVGERLGGLFVR